MGIRYESELVLELIEESNFNFGLFIPQILEWNGMIIIYSLGPYAN